MRQTEWDGEIRVDLRQYDVLGRPTRKGISLSLPRYKMLQDAMVRLTSKLEEAQSGSDVDYKEHLGANHYAQVKSPYSGVGLRRWFRPKCWEMGQPLLPGPGIFLNTREWDEVVKVNMMIEDFIPKLSTTQRCDDGLDHCNQMGALNCIECNPNGDYLY